MTSGGNLVEHQTENHNNQNIVNNPLGNSLTKRVSIKVKRPIGWKLLSSVYIQYSIVCIKS